MGGASLRDGGEGEELSLSLPSLKLTLGGTEEVLPVFSEAQRLCQLGFGLLHVALAAPLCSTTSHSVWRAAGQ